MRLICVPGVIIFKTKIFTVFRHKYVGRCTELIIVETIFGSINTHTVHWSNKKINDRHKRNHFNGRANNIKTDIDKNNIVEMLKPLRWLSWTHAFNQLFITQTPSQCIIYVYTHPSTHLTNGFTDDLYNDFCFYFFFSFSSVCFFVFCCYLKHILIYCA